MAGTIGKFEGNCLLKYVLQMFLVIVGNVLVA